jgi:hypothetical protein
MDEKNAQCVGPVKYHFVINTIRFRRIYIYVKYVEFFSYILIYPLFQVEMVEIGFGDGALTHSFHFL